MQRKWLFTLLFITSLFIVYSFFIDTKLVIAYRWMTIGMSLISFVYYYIVTSSNEKDSKKMIGGNLAAIVLKFILSGMLIILYIIFFKMKTPLDFVFFFTAYSIYSVVNYGFSYNYKKG